MLREGVLIKRCEGVLIKRCEGVLIKRCEGVLIKRSHTLTQHILVQFLSVLGEKPDDGHFRSKHVVF
jgi:hypothetical protein